MASDVSLIAAATVVVRRWRTFVFIPPAIGLAAAVLTLAGGSEFAAESVFAPQGSSGITSGSLSGLAARFGVPVPGAETSGSVDFYAQLLESRELMVEVVSSPYRVFIGPAATDSMTGDLTEVLGIRGDTREERVRRGLAVLKERVAVSVDIRSGLVALRTAAPWGNLAELINRRMLDLVGQFDLQKRRSQARAEREFVERRSEEAQRDLVLAERELEAFLERNRSYHESPRLTFEAAGLERRVEMRQQLYSMLAQAYEQAKVAEVRDTPVITIISRPEGSARRDSRLVLNALLGLFLGVTLALTVSVIVEHLAARRAEAPEEYQAFRQAREQSVMGFLSWLRWRK